MNIQFMMIAILILGSLLILSISLRYFHKDKEKTIDLNTPTKYRSVCKDGYNTYLEYLTPSNKWKRVWYPYYDTFWGREKSELYDDVLYVCNYNTNLELFIKKYPIINDYFKWAEVEQDRLKQLAVQYHKNIDKRKGTKNLN